MGLTELFSVIERAGIRLTADGEAIRAQPRQALTDDLRSGIREHRAAILERLGAGAEAERLANLRASFDLVTAAFRLPAEEMGRAWSIALADLPGAEACFHADAAMIRAGWKPLEEQASAFLSRRPT